MGLTAVAVNGDNWNSDVYKSLQQNEYQVIITSPDMALEHAPFRTVLSSQTLAKKTLAVVIDESHCISQWGDNFRPLYNRLGELRSYIPAKVPFLTTSATLPPLVLAQVRSSLHIDPLESYHLSIGTDRPNIAYFVHHMKAGKSDLDALNFVLRADLAKDEITELVQTMVFFDDINLVLLRWRRTFL
ncbi:hypothetical protein BDP27DRAFT_1501998 [Rhodocollybia butyracea]|uniref:Helicase ATP-binding domain-containing protein n=1 Tax=Rhodocollybia butyracea TaxID=206335 RepID=A0A9P5PZL9_9AGAR|nr:hypothetical protein BDP27DRAFT_1501998 [Rhodocollybia butyracea]